MSGKSNQGYRYVRFNYMNCRCTKCITKLPCTTIVHKITHNGKKRVQGFVSYRTFYYTNKQNRLT